IGARGSDVLTQFLVESIVMSLAGGVIGLLVGFGGAALLGRLTGWHTATPAIAVAIAVGFSAAVGMFFGYYPARKAAALNPRQAQNTAALNSTAVSQSKLAFLPNLNVSANTAQDYGRNFSQTDGQIVNTTTNTLNAGVSSSVTVFDGMKNLSNLRSAQASEDAGEKDLSRAKQTAVFTVASNFLSLITQQQQLAVQQQNLAAQEALENQISQFDATEIGRAHV